MSRAKPQRLGRSARAPIRRTTGGLVTTRSTRGGWGVSYRIAVDVPLLDPVAVVDHVSDVLLAEHWHAIGQGRRADGSGPQPKLNPVGRSGRRAKAGQRPAARGYTGLTTKPFRDNITRAPIKVRGKTLRRARIVQGVRALAGQNFRIVDKIEGTRASTKIQPAKIHRNFVQREQKRNVAYLFATGAIAKLVDVTLAQYFGMALKGFLVKGRKRELKAAKARSK